MSKDESMQLKGIAIIMMLWLHLFSDLDATGQCANLLFYKGRPLAYMLTKLCSCCVPLYTLLGGYGLAATFQRRQGQMHNGQRAWRLMKRFWAVCLLFVPLGCLLRPQLYPGSLPELLMNLSAFGYSYNGTWWFLMPYILLTLGSHGLISVLNKSSRWQEGAIMAGLALLHILAYGARGNIALPIPYVSQLFVVLVDAVYLLFMFAIGVLVYKHNWVELFRQKVVGSHSAAALLALVGVCFLRISIGNSALLHPPFALLIVLLYTAIGKAAAVSRSLLLLGRHSASLWLCHQFFIDRLLAGQVYALRSPVVIFLALLGLSLMASLLLSWLQRLAGNIR